MIDVHLCMVTWDRLSYTKQALKSLMKQKNKDWKLTIVDNGSLDGTVDYLKTLKDERIDIVLWEENKGLSTATDYVFGRATTKYIGRVDNDIILPVNWLDRCLQAHEAYDNFGFIGGFHFKSEDLAERQPKPSEFNGVEVWEKQHIGGCSFLLRRKNYKEKIGGQGVMGLTDYQLAWKEQGFVNGYLYPLVYVQHLEDPREPHHIDTEEYDNTSLRVRGVAGQDWINQQSERDRFHLDENIC